MYTKALCSVNWGSWLTVTVRTNNNVVIGINNRVYSNAKRDKPRQTRSGRGRRTGPQPSSTSPEQ